VLVALQVNDGLVHGLAETQLQGLDAGHT
jgi:hypothetical protein